MRNSYNLLLTVLLFLVFTLNLNAQEGFRAEVNIGPAIGDSKEYFSYALQGNFYYLWKLSESFDLGINTGVLLFLGEGNNADGSNGLFSSIPDVFIPISVASRINLSESFYAGLDIGYALSANAFGDSDGSLIEEDNGNIFE
ncbi:hypothetical protein [Seonamhaeicola maritimus]|uniref:PorT family protein n=1 Tax=Seonamhaeicola maritimus TaxID=2591822 RepID=A0A5C7GKB0_9FLAO|nr:hypothetical protein [Seonamhaeicola maritimus]TXG38665.1 hypothetical protein FUA22_01930 [Seonamhaeicola maritimus]